MFYRLYFKLTFVIFMIVAIVITALWPHMYAKFDGFGFYVEGIGGYHDLVFVAQPILEHLASLVDT